MAITYDINDSQGKVAQLYAAILNRIPDQGGLENWTQEILGGKTVTDIANAIYGAEEARQTVPESMSHGDLVSALYQNLLGRAPDAEGLAFWTSQLDQGRTPGDVTADLIAAVDNYAGTDPIALASQQVLQQHAVEGIHAVTGVGADTPQDGPAGGDVAVGIDPAGDAGVANVVDTTLVDAGSADHQAAATAEVIDSASEAGAPSIPDATSTDGTGVDQQAAADTHFDHTGGDATAAVAIDGSGASATGIANATTDSGNAAGVSVSTSDVVAASTGTDVGSNAGRLLLAETNLHTGNEIAGTATFLTGPTLSIPVLSPELMSNIAAALNAHPPASGSPEDVYAFVVKPQHDDHSDIYLFNYADANHDAVIETTELALVGVSNDNIDLTHTHISV